MRAAIGLSRAARQNRGVDDPALVRPRIPTLVLALAALLFVAAIGVRGIAPRKVVRPQDVPVAERPKLRDPVQLVGPAAGLRAQELDALVSAEHAAEFRAMRAKLFTLAGCPELLTWCETVDGQRLERLLNDLRAGTREDAFAGLVLVFRLGRACEWKPGLLAKTANAEKLGAFFQDWLRVWAEPGARDPLLSDAALSACLAYGRVMSVAWKAPLIGVNAAPYERAHIFLAELAGIPPARRTAFGEALQTRYPRALTRLLDGKDALAGFVEESSVQAPDFGGECGR